MRVTVVGVGNVLLSDEGFGPAVVATLASRFETEPKPDDVRIVDGGVLGMKLLPYFQQSDHVIVVDALDAGAEPGSLFRFTPEEAELEAGTPVSAHEIALPHLLQIAALAGAHPEVVIIGCQVADISTPAMELTAPVAAAVDRAAELVLREIERAGGAP